MRNGAHGITGTERKVRGSLAFRRSKGGRTGSVSLAPGINIPRSLRNLSASFFLSFFEESSRLSRDS